MTNLPIHNEKQTEEDANILQLQSQISALTEKIQELTFPTKGRPEVWCTGCYKVRMFLSVLDWEEQDPLVLRWYPHQSGRQEDHYTWSKTQNHHKN